MGNGILQTMLRHLLFHRHHHFAVPEGNNTSDLSWRRSLFERNQLRRATQHQPRRYSQYNELPPGAHLFLGPDIGPFILATLDPRNILRTTTHFRANLSSRVSRSSHRLAQRSAGGSIWHQPLTRGIFYLPPRDTTPRRSYAIIRASEVFPLEPNQEILQPSAETDFGFGCSSISPLKNYGYCRFAQNGAPTRREEGKCPSWTFD